MAAFPGGFPRRTLPVLFVTLLWVGHIAHNGVWLARDERPPRDDFAAHYQRSLKASFHVANCHRLLVKGPPALRDFLVRGSEEHPFLARALAAPISGVVAFAQVIHVSGSYPPLGYLIGGPVLALAGEDPDALALAWGMAFVGVLLFSTYGLVRTFAGPWAGVLAAALVGSFPWVGGLSRLLLLDMPLAAMVTLALWALARTRAFEDRRASLLFGWALGAALLTKQIAPVFIAGPFLSVALPLWRTRRDPASRPRRKNLLAACLVALAVSGSYYVPRFPGTVSHFFDIEEGGRVEKDLGPGDLENYLYYPVYLMEQMGGAGALLLLVALWPFARKKGGVRSFLLAWIALPYLFFTFFANKDLRYTVPYLPAFAALTAVGIAGIPWRRAAAAVGIAGAALAALLYAHASWEFPWGRPYRFAVGPERPGASSRIEFHFPVTTEFAPSSEDWRTREILDLVRRECPPRGKVRVWVLAIMGEVTHALEASQVLEEQRFRYGFSDGYYDVAWKWREGKGDPGVVLVPSTHWGTEGARDQYEENVRRFREIESRYRLAGMIELPHDLSLEVHVLAGGALR